MALVERVDKSIGGQIFELLLWILNVAAVVFIAIIGWLMSSLVDKVDALDTRTRAVEISMAGLAQAPRDLIPPWLLSRIEHIEGDVKDLQESGSAWTRGQVEAMDKRLDSIEGAK